MLLQTITTTIAYFDDMMTGGGREEECEAARRVDNNIIYNDHLHIINLRNVSKIFNTKYLIHGVRRMG